MTFELDRALDALKVEFATEIAAGEITHIGTFNCRRKNHKPEAPWSEHSWPNAADIHVKTKDGPVGDRLAAWMRSRPDLWSEVFWKIALHHDHVHGTAAPRRNFDNTQVPPCAGGPEEDMSYLPINVGDGIGDKASKRSDVASIQGLLNEVGADITEDGKYGDETKSAVAALIGGDGSSVYGSNYKVLIRKVAQQYSGEKGDPGPSPTGATFSYD